MEAWHNPPARRASSPPAPSAVPRSDEVHALAPTARAPPLLKVPAAPSRRWRWWPRRRHRWASRAAGRSVRPRAREPRALSTWITGDQACPGRAAAILPGRGLAPQDGADRRPAARPVGLLVGQVGGRGQQTRAGSAFREPAIHVDPDGRARQTEVPVALAAELAGAAGVVRLDGDLLAGHHVGDPRADRDDGPDELVPHDERVAHAPLTAPDPVVRPAEPRRAHAHDRLAGSGDRPRIGLARRILRPMRAAARLAQRYSSSSASRYSSRITFRFTLSVGVRKPFSTVKSPGRIANFLILA